MSTFTMSPTNSTTHEKYRLLTPQEWEAQKDNIKFFYIDEALPLREVVWHMQEVHQFKATERMYKARFATWGWRKYNVRKTATKDDPVLGTDLQFEDHLSTQPKQAASRSDLENTEISTRSNSCLSSIQEDHGDSPTCKRRKRPIVIHDDSTPRQTKQRPIAPRPDSLPALDSDSGPSEETESVQTIEASPPNTRHLTLEERNITVLNDFQSEPETNMDDLERRLRHEKSSKSRSLPNKFASQQTKDLSSWTNPEVSSSTVPISPSDSDEFSSLIDFEGKQGLQQNTPPQDLTKNDPSQEESNSQQEVGLLGYFTAAPSPSARMRSQGGYCSTSSSSRSGSCASSLPAAYEAHLKRTQDPRNKVVVHQHDVGDLAYGLRNLRLDMPRRKDCNPAYYP